MRPFPKRRSRIPRVLRVFGYRCRRTRRWIGYCIELNLKAEGRDWEEVQERLLMAASLVLAKLTRQHGSGGAVKAPFRVRALYAYIAVLHFMRPNHEKCLADVSSGLLIES